MPSTHVVLPIFLIALAAILRGDETAFEIDVEAVLAKAGCNAGTCHGNQNGKGGFRLSLRGQDPEFDYAAIAGELGGRRIDLLSPRESLLLQKPTLQIAHQGGRRFDPGSELYELLENWVARGAIAPSDKSPAVRRLSVSPSEKICFAPEESIQITVEAEFSDGQRKDVTRLAVYEASNLNVSIGEHGLIHRDGFGEATVIVRYLNEQVPVRVAFLDQRSDFVWTGPSPRNYVDQHVFAKLRRFHANPAALCEDHVFLRRAYLDTLGLLPSGDDARRFIQDTNPRKRDILIDALLSRPEFADNWALKWADLLHVEEKVLDPTGVDVFHRWIHDSFASGKPLATFVRELLEARGSTYNNPPTNYFRSLRKTNQRGEAAARVFLGIRLQCAQCHNHPFDHWTQDDYFSWASVFARVDYKILENKPDDKLDKNQFKGEQIVLIKDEGEVKNPTSGRLMSPRFLGEPNPIGKESKRVDAMAQWLTSADNQQFARAQVNRLWYHLMGRGLVDPVDDFRVTNPASHPNLLEELTADFIESDFDIRHILGLIMRSGTYQRSSTGTQSDANYARAMLRRRTAEQLLDAQSSALRMPIEFNGHELGLRSGQLPGVHKVRDRKQKPSPGDRFLFAFGKPERLMASECERSDATTLSQALLLVNGECIDATLTADQNLIGKMLRQAIPVDDMIQQLYWEALSRAPNETELQHSHSILGRSHSVRQGLEDIAWALLNAKEFVFRQ